MSADVLSRAANPSTPRYENEPQSRHRRRRPLRSDARRCPLRKRHQSHPRRQEMGNRPVPGRFLHPCGTGGCHESRRAAGCGLCRLRHRRHRHRRIAGSLHAGHHPLQRPEDSAHHREGGFHGAGARSLARGSGQRRFPRPRPRLSSGHLHPAPRPHRLLRHRRRLLGDGNPRPGGHRGQNPRAGQRPPGIRADRARHPPAHGRKEFASDPRHRHRHGNSPLR